MRGLSQDCAITIGLTMNDRVDQQPAYPVPVPETPPISTPPGTKSSWFSPWLVVAVLALGLAAWQWMETRVRLAETQQELAKRLSESDSLAKESGMLAKQVQEQLNALMHKIGELEGKLAESQSQQEVLESLYQKLTRSHEESALAEIEQSVTLASQQLQLAGNVQGAVLALQAADVRLAGSNRPQFLGLRKALVRDLDRLRALPQLDIPGMYMRLESVIAAIDTLPLAVNGRPREETGVPHEVPVPRASMLSSDYWRLLAADFWKELRALIRIQRFDRDEPALLAPGQAFFLRENLKLRLLNARLALLSRDQWTYRNELIQAQVWLQRYFDSGEKVVQANLQALKQLSATEISIELPSLNESLSAIKGVRVEKERR